MGFQLDEVSVVHGEARLLDRVSATLDTGRCTAVVGQSGAGKSTLLRLLNRLGEPTAGRVLLDGTPLAELDVLALRRRVGLVGQRPVLLGDRVADDLRVGAPGLSDDAVRELLDRVGLAPEFAQHLTARLSGGEAQRVCLARTLAVGPQVLLLDEPTSALDGASAAVIVAATRAHLAGGGTAVLISHDLAVVRELADMVLVLETGRVVAAGRCDEVAYLGAA